MSHQSSSRSDSRTRRSPRVASSQLESCEGTSRRSRSPSSTFSSGGYASGGGRRSSRSRSPYQSWKADEDLQEGQPLLDFASVLGILCSLNGLPKAPSESHKIHGFRAALKDDDQPTASYKLPISSASADILADIDDRVSSRRPGCNPGKSLSCSSIQVSTAGNFTVLRERTSPRPRGLIAMSWSWLDSEASTTSTRWTSSGPPRTRFRLTFRCGGDFVDGPVDLRDEVLIAEVHR